MQYIEMIAHRCKSVHAPGVSWPQCAAPPPPRKSISLQSKSLVVKEQIIELLSSGAKLTAKGVQAGIGWPLSTTQKNLYVLTSIGMIKATKIELTRGKPVNIYSLPETQCNTQI